MSVLRLAVLLIGIVIARPVGATAQQPKPAFPDTSDARRFRELWPHLADSTALRVGLRPETSCPIRLFRPDTARVTRIPVIRGDSSRHDPMPVAPSRCRPVFK